jgi:hypothetical protein
MVIFGNEILVNMGVNIGMFNILMVATLMFTLMEKCIKEKIISK